MKYLKIRKYLIMSRRKNEFVGELRQRTRSEVKKVLAQGHSGRMHVIYSNMTETFGKGIALDESSA